MAFLETFTIDGLRFSEVKVTNSCFFGKKWLISVILDLIRMKIFALYLVIGMVECCWKCKTNLFQIEFRSKRNFLAFRK